MTIDQRQSLGTDERAREYSRLKDRLALLGMATSLLTSSGFVFTGLAARVNRTMLPERNATLRQRLLYSATLSLASSVASLPMSFYSGYRVEKKYGLSNQTPSSWAGDVVRQRRSRSQLS